MTESALGDLVAAPSAALPKAHAIPPSTARIEYLAGPRSCHGSARGGVSCAACPSRRWLEIVITDFSFTPLSAETVDALMEDWDTKDDLTLDALSFDF